MSHPPEEPSAGTELPARTADVRPVGDGRVSLRWKSLEVEGRRARFGVAEPPSGAVAVGPPVLFLHGWLLAAAAYSGGMHELARRGHRVLAPDLPGFGGTAGLPAGETNFSGYVRWLNAFLETTGVDGDLAVVGHSFGGAVAATTAGMLGPRIRHLVLVNAVGGGVWTQNREGRVRAMAERPLWDWGRHFPGDLWAPNGVTVLPRILGEAVPNLVRNPRALVSVANLARTANLAHELSQLRHHGVPVSVVWSERDGVIPRASFDAMCKLLSVEGQVVRGAHAWLIGDPRRFARVVGELLGRADPGADAPAPPEGRALAMPA